jgi:hypothetical protein
MNPEIRARWTAALRSGDYPQGLEALRQVRDGGEYEYCCLGVLCELARAEGVEIALEYDEDEGVWSYDGESAYLPPAVAEWAGLPVSEQIDTDTGRRWCLPSVNVPGGGKDTLVVLNDHDRWNFAQIADAIDGGAS